MSLAVIKVGLDPKKSTQYRRTLNPTTGVITSNIIEYWIVVWNGKQTDPSANLGASAGGNTLPSLSDSYGGVDTLPIVTEINPQLVGNSGGQMYMVQVTYSHVAPSGSTGKWEVAVSFDGIPIQETVYFDLDNKAVRNSAHQEISSQPNETYYDTAVKISFKTDSFDETDAEALRGFVNSGDVTLTISALGYSRTFPAKTLRLENFSSTPTVTSGALAYWSVSMEFTYRPLITAPTHGDETGSISTLEKMLIVDQGYGYLNPSTGPGPDLITFTDKDVPVDQGGTPLNKPCNLDGSGADGRSLGSDPYYLSFRNHDNGDFSPLFTGIS